MAEDKKQESFLNPSRRSYVYESTKGGGNKKRVIFIIIGLVILIALVAVAVIATGGKGENGKNPVAKIQPTSTPTPTIVTPTPNLSITPTPSKGTPTPKISPSPTKGTPTPTPKTTITPTGSSSSTVDKATGLDRANLKIAVENGSGTVGAATKASDFLKNLGYVIASSGNADNFNYTDVTIQVKSTKKAYLDLLKKDMSATYTVSSATSDYTGNSDAVVIIGK